MALLGIRKPVLFVPQTDGSEHSKKMKYSTVPYSWCFSTAVTTLHRCGKAGYSSLAKTCDYVKISFKQHYIGHDSKGKLGTLSNPVPYYKR